jgi:uncharacterized membrane protein
MRALLLITAGSFVYYVLHGLAFRVHNYDSSSVPSDIALAAISSLIGGLILGLVFWLVNRFAGQRGRVGTAIALGLVSAVMYPVAFYLSWWLMWGIGAIVMVQDAEPGRARTAARVFGAIAVLEVVVSTVAWLLGSGWHPGCSTQDCHPK